MFAGRAEKKLSAFVISLIVLGILVVVNMFSQRHFLRLDLTEEKQYTLGKASVSAAKSLEDYLTVTLYISKSLPPNLDEIKRNALDILGEYEAYSRGRLRVRVVDPGDDEELRQKLARLGIQEVSWRVAQKDKFEMAKGYFGVALAYGDRVESIPIVGNIDTFEYDVTASILKVSAPDVRTIGFLTGHQEYDPYIELNSLRTYLEKQYRISSIDLSRMNRVPEVDTLIVAQPMDISERQAYILDQFLVRGGNLVLLLDPVKMIPNQLRAEPINTGLEDVLRSYGIEFSKALVADPVNFSSTFSMGYIRMTMPYPFFVKVVRQNMYRENPALDKVDNLLFPWAGSLNVLDEKLGGRKSSVLMTSSEQSWNMPYWNLDPRQQFAPPQGGMKKQPLAVLITGKFKSYFKDREEPDEEPPAEGMPPAPPASIDKIDEGTEDAALLVVSSARFVNESFMRQSPGSMVFLLNAIDQIAFGDQLISLRSRGIKQRLLKPDISDNTRVAARYLNIFGLPFIVVVLAIVRTVVVRKRRRAHAR